MITIDPNDTDAQKFSMTIGIDQHSKPQQYIPKLIAIDIKKLKEEQQKDITKF
jgi:hypothetical protein